MGMKKRIINIVYSIICIALAVAVLIVMSKCSGVRIFINTEDGWAYADRSCMDVAFGEPSGGGYVALFNGSPLLCLEVFLLIIAAFLILYTAFDNIFKRRSRAICGVIATICFLFAGVLFFLNGQLYNLGDYFYRYEVIEQILAGNMKLYIGPGAIIAGLLSFYAAYATAIKSVLTIVKVL